MAASWRGSWLAPSAILALVVMGVPGWPGAALAQEAATPTPAVAATATPVGNQPGLELDLVPDELGGFPTEVTLTRGREHFDGLDADDPAAAATLAELAALLAATGRPVEDLTTALALVATEELFAFVVAFRIAGAPDGTLMPAYLPLLLDDLQVTRQESGQLAGHDVLVVYSDEGEGEVPLYIVAVGDTVWLFQGPEDVVIGALEGLTTP
ncbi:hypothetical protein BH23CHL8_BH23CHL8_12910 [soil metagenome]